MAPRQVRKDAKPQAAKVEPTAGKTKVTVYLTAEAAKNLRVHAAGENLDRSAVVEQLINTHLKTWWLSRRHGATPLAGPHNPQGQPTPTATPTDGLPSSARQG